MPKLRCILIARYTYVSNFSKLTVPFSSTVQSLNLIGKRKAEGYREKYFRITNRKQKLAFRKCMYTVYTDVLGYLARYGATFRSAAINCTLYLKNFLIRWHLVLYARFFNRNNVLVDSVSFEGIFERSCE